MNPISSETRKKMSVAAKAAWASGRKVAMPTEKLREYASMRDVEKMYEVNRRTCAARKGVEIKSGPAAKGPNHHKAKFWAIKSPDQQIIKGMNLNELIRQNAGLFDPDDVVWYGKSKHKCRASKGISRLFEMRKDGAGPRVNSWKGWVIA